MFKYLDIAGAKKTLEGRSVKFARPVAFNDPFDVHLEEVLGHDIEAFASQLVEANYAYLCGEIDYAALKDDEYKDKIILMNGALKIATPAKKAEIKKLLLAQPISETYDLARMKKVNEVALEEVRKGLQNYGVFCASLRPDSLLMWAHYAEKHTGVVFRFDADASKDSMFLEAKEVKYIHERPLLYRSGKDMIMSYYGASSIHTASDALDRLIFSKSTEWAYEGEVRLAIPELVSAGEPFSLLKFYPGELIEVIFGCRIADAHRSEISVLAKAVNPEVKFFQARTDRREYALNFDAA